MGKVEFNNPIASIRGVLIRGDPYYFRRYPKTGGGVMHIVQARPNRKGHVASPAETANRREFAEKYGRQKHEEWQERQFKNQLEIPFKETAYGY